MAKRLRVGQTVRVLDIKSAWDGCIGTVAGYNKINSKDTDPWGVEFGDFLGTIYFARKELDVIPPPQEQIAADYIALTNLPPYKQ